MFNWWLLYLDVHTPGTFTEKWYLLPSCQDQIELLDCMYCSENPPSVLVWLREQVTLWCDFLTSGMVPNGYVNISLSHEGILSENTLCIQTTLPVNTEAIFFQLWVEVMIQGMDLREKVLWLDFNIPLETGYTVWGYYKVIGKDE